MEKKEEIKKKTSGILVTVLIVLLLLVFAGFGYAVGGVRLNRQMMENVSTESEKVQDNKSTTVVYDTTDEKVYHLIDHIIVSGTPTCGQPIEKLANDKKVEAKDISNDDAWVIAFYDSSVSGDSIPLETVEKAIKKYLGEDYIFDPKEVKAGICGYNYEYDDSTKTFNNNPVEGGCGGTCPAANTSYRMTKAVEKDGILTINVKVVFGSSGNSDHNTYYSDYNRTNAIGSYGRDKLEDLYIKGGNYQFTFKLENGNYVFVSSELA